MITKLDALTALGFTGTLRQNQLFIDSNNPPSEEAIEAKLIELQADYDSKQYQRNWASEYPSITDVVVALAEKQEGDDTMWQKITAQRAKVKLDNPKPE